MGLKKSLITIGVLLSLSSAFAIAEIKGEFISPPGLFPANHSASIVELPDKSLISCWYAGSEEGGDDVQIFCSRATLLGKSWSAPYVVVREGEKTDGAWLANDTLGNPTVFIDGDGILWLFYVTRSFGGWTMSRVDYKISRDLGQTWTNGKRLQDGMGHLTRSKPLNISYDDKTKTQVMMLPLYREFTSKYSYTCMLTLRDGQVVDKLCHEVPGEGHLQPALVMFKGRLFAFMRNTEGTGVLKSEFDLQRLEWSEPVPTGLPNPNSSVDAIVSNQGQIVLVYNGSNSERNPLSIAVSKDGERFEKLFDLEYDEKPSLESEFSYPSIIRTSDSFFHVVYTYRHRSAIKHVRLCTELLCN